MLPYPATIPLLERTLATLSGWLREHRRRIGSRWRRLDPGRQALLVLAHLRNGDTYTRLAAGFGVGVATVYRYLREAYQVVEGMAPTLTAALWQAAWCAYVICDGTLVPIDRVTPDRPYYSGKHKRHGVNLQILADPAGRLI